MAPFRVVRTVKGDAMGLHLVRGASVTALADELAAALAAEPPDPFAAPLVLTPGAGLQRWLSQFLARASDPGGEGICAGLDFQPLARLPRLLSGVDPRDDPWSPERLVWPILDLAPATPGLEALARNLAAGDQTYANAARVAGLLGRYAAYRPEMLRAWAQAPSADELGLGFDSWQAVLWRALHAVVPGPDPTTRADALTTGLLEGHVEVPWPRVFVFAPRRVSRPDADLLAVLGRRVRVDVWLLDPRGHPLAPALGRRAAHTAGLLEEVATDVRLLDSPQVPGPVVEVHASHGPDRQVEVLREVLAGLLEDDRSLEPRDIAVLSPTLPDVAPHLLAAFTPTEGEPARQHPGRRFRIQVSGLEGAETNELYRLVRAVVELGSTRATASQLLDLAAHPFVGRRFGIGPEEAERLTELVPAASIRWGLNVSHRESFGLTVRQNTWTVGVQRLLLGLTLGAGHGAAAGFVTPVDEVESTDAPLLGALAELVSRTARLVAACASPDTATAWVGRFRAIVDSLAEVPFDASWQLGQWWAVLDELARRADGAPSVLGTADALALLEHEFAERGTRPAFGTGGIVVASLGPLDQVPHRVVCLLGVDDRAFPRRGIADGDDLLARAPRPGEPDPGADDRQSLLDALLASGSRLIVVHQGRSTLTNEQHPPAPGLVDLIEFAGPGTVVEESLQPFTPSNFSATGDAPRSFDGAALAAARALCDTRHPTPDPFEVGRLPQPDPGVVDLEQLRQFLRHPGRFFLRQRAGLTLFDEESAPEALPLELDPLARWAVGERVLEDLARGLSPDAARQAEWLRGELPPGRIGERQLADVCGTALDILGSYAPYAESAVEPHAVDLTIEGTRLTGRGTTRGGRVVSLSFSRPRPKRLADAWLEALALTVALDRPIDAVVVGNRRRAHLRAPTPERAAIVLADVTSLAAEAQCEVLPMPAETSWAWASLAARGRDPLEGDEVRRAWSRDEDEVWRRLLPHGGPPWGARLSDEPWAQPGERTRLGALARLVWRPIVEAEV